MRIPLQPLALLILLLVPAQKAGAQPASQPPVTEARAVIREILATPEFTRRADVPLASQVVERVRAWLREMLDRAGVGPGAGQAVVETGAWILATLAVVGLVVLVIRRRWRMDGPLPLMDTAPRRSESSRQWVALTEQALASGDARLAIRYAHMAVIRRFEEQGVWRVDDARTPREYLRLLPVADGRREILRQLSAEFERSWYGVRAADGSRIWQWLEACGCPVAPPRAT